MLALERVARARVSYARAPQLRYLCGGNVDGLGRMHYNRIHMRLELARFCRDLRDKRFRFSS
jgi:hypothetical protein